MVGKHAGKHAGISRANQTRVSCSKYPYDAQPDQVLSGVCRYRADQTKRSGTVYHRLDKPGTQ